jgi:hypothetical protein
LDESCWRTARLWSFMSEPVVSGEDFAAGPLLLPGLPGIPAPEFCALGTVVCAPGAVVCAEAGSVTIATATAPVSNLNMANSILYDNESRSLPTSYCFPPETLSRTTSFPGSSRQLEQGLPAYRVLVPKGLTSDYTEPRHS